VLQKDSLQLDSVLSNKKKHNILTMLIGLLHTQPLKAISQLKEALRQTIIK